MRISKSERAGLAGRQPESCAEIGTSFTYLNHDIDVLKGFFKTVSMLHVAPLKTSSSDESL